jgi:hypothetical protein
LFTKHSIIVAGSQIVPETLGRMKREKVVKIVINGEPELCTRVGIHHAETFKEMDSRGELN